MFIVYADCDKIPAIVFYYLTQRVYLKVDPFLFLNEEIFSNRLYTQATCGGK